MSGIQQTDDTQLLSGLRMGDEQTFSALFRKYYAALCVYARQKVNVEDADDIVQNLMVWLWENREMLVIETTLRSYLFAAVRNSCYTLMNKNEIHREVHEHLYEEMRELFEDPDFYVVEDLTARMEEAINALPETYREAFVKNRFEQKTYRDIAEESGVSAKTIDYRIQQAIKQLRITLKDYAPLIGWLLYD